LNGAGEDAAARPTVRVAAPAKLNLYLHVTGRRPDGYHVLDSLVAFAGVHDTVAARPADDLSLDIDGPFAAALGADAAENLVLRAARALAGERAMVPRAALRLVKRLPVASGLGGGSADAAATLRALCELWGVAPPADRLSALSLAVGADVPVCLAGRAAFVGGIGERLAPAPALPPAGLVLVNPGVAVDTPAVFAARSGGFSAPARFDAPAADAAALADLLKARRNDLTAPAIGLAPAIRDALAALAVLPGALIARMSGSGATCFALFADLAAAATAAALLRRRRPGWWVAAADLIGDIEALRPD
jgi:4-diphosphocytidyl-2-C-methyl-D-erythritol kinase